jgi:LysR family hydrogen peroxide-inducible transcriptional activator
MNLKFVKYCIAVHKHGNFTLAARIVGVAQPTLSVAIRRLEEQLGVRLFEREGVVRLTPSGRALLPLFQRLDDCAVAIERSALHMSSREAA